MIATIEVIEGGHGNSIQDRGRVGYRHMGIAVSGQLDAIFARCANALVGNAESAACLEMRAAGPTLKVRAGPLRVAMSGEVAATIQRPDGRQRRLAAWCSASLDNGDVMKIGAIAGGTAYLAVSGGIGVVPQLGSRSTYLRAAIGGCDGRLLAAGDSFPCRRLERDDLGEYRATPWRHDGSPIRAISGPQTDCFGLTALADFLAQPYTVSVESDRMGMRLAGPALAHRDADSADIVSDGVAPGAIQVPGDGQPIVLLADCQTVGGYPKIATVITADLCRLGQCRPGATIRFALVDLATAAALLAAREARWQHWRESIRGHLPLDYVDENALYRSNLIGGVLRAEP